MTRTKHITCPDCKNGKIFFKMSDVKAVSSEKQDVKQYTCPTPGCNFALSANGIIFYKGINGGFGKNHNPSTSTP